MNSVTKSWIFWAIFANFLGGLVAVVCANLVYWNGLGMADNEWKEHLTEWMRLQEDINTNFAKTDSGTASRIEQLEGRVTKLEYQLTLLTNLIKLLAVTSKLNSQATGINTEGVNDVLMKIELLRKVFPRDEYRERYRPENPDEMPPLSD